MPASVILVLQYVYGLSQHATLIVTVLYVSTSTFLHANVLSEPLKAA